MSDESDGSDGSDGSDRSDRSDRSDGLYKAPAHQYTGIRKGEPPPTVISREVIQQGTPIGVPSA